MLDIGWNELLIIALVTILVVGPKELPHVLRTVTQFFRKLRAMAGEFQSGLDDLAREAELQDLKQNIEKTASSDFAGELEREFDPTGEIDRSVRELESEVKEDPRTSAASTGKKGPGKPAESAGKRGSRSKHAASSADAELSIASSAQSGGGSKTARTASGGGARKPAARARKKSGKTS